MPKPKRTPPRWSLGRINPILKIALGCAMTLLAVFLKDLSAMAVLVGGLGLILSQMRIPLIVWLYSGLTLFVFAASSYWLLDEGSKAFLNTLRLLAILLPTPVLALSTPPADLIRSLQVLRLPSFLTLSVMLIWRFFPLMQQELQRIWEANQLRGIDLRKQPQQWFSGLLVPLVFQMVAYADDVTVGLQTRGYSPTEPRSNSKPMRWSGLDTLFCIVFGLWFLGIVYLEWG